jgi:hypothetical protein
MIRNQPSAPGSASSPRASRRPFLDLGQENHQPSLSALRPEPLIPSVVVGGEPRAPTVAELPQVNPCPFDVLPASRSLLAR